jgi:hypothetical protein
MNQGIQGYRLTKKTEGRKSRETFPLRSAFLTKILVQESVGLTKYPTW